MTDHHTRSMKTKVAAYLASHIFEWLTVFFFVVAAFYYVGAEKTREAHRAATPATEEAAP